MLTFILCIDSLVRELWNALIIAYIKKLLSLHHLFFPFHSIDFIHPFIPYFSELLFPQMNILKQQNIFECLIITLFIMAVFGLVGVTLDGIRVVEAIIDDNTFKCAGEINIIGSAFRMILSLCLTIFVLLHHKVCKPYAYCVYLIHININ